MENKDNNSYNYNHRHKNSINNRSMSDTESQSSPVDSFHSPLRSPFRSDEPLPPSEKSPSKAMVVAVDKYYSPLRSPPRNHHKPPENLNAPPKAPPPAVIFNRAVREDLASRVTRVGPPPGTNNENFVGGGEDGGVGGERRSRTAVASILKRPATGEETAGKAALGFRVCEVILCLISFSVMAADKTQGWSGDSFDRYKEYRF